MEQASARFKGRTVEQLGVYGCASCLPQSLETPQGGEHDNQRELAASMLYDNTIDYRHHERMLQVVEQTIEHMGEPPRTILWLCALKRNTYRQTADIMGISVHTVKKHMSKAYDMLRRTLNDKYSSGEIEKGL